MIQNTALRLVTRRKERNMPTRDLLEETDALSVHQIGAEAILNEAKKVLISGKPAYLKEALQVEENRKGEKKIKKRKNKLNLTDEGFVQKATLLLNQIPPEMLAEEEMKRFKKMSEKWVKSNINPKPY